MKTSIFRLSILFIPICLLAIVPAFAQDANVRKVLDLDDVSNLRLVEPTGVHGYGDDQYVEQDGVYVCDASANGSAQFGVAFSYRLDQQEATPIVASGWSRAENVGGNRDANYSLYVDVIYQDDTPLWGQTYAFPNGDSDWSEGKVAIFPDKPIKSLTVYGMFRNHSGKASFKDLKLHEYQTPGESTYFNGVSVAVDRQGSSEPKVLLRDVGQRSDFVELNANDASSKRSVDALQLGLVTRQTKLACGLTESTFVVDSSNDADRALSFVYAIPFPNVPKDATWVWFDSPRRTRDVTQNELATTHSFSKIGVGRLSKYPFGVVAAKDAQGRYVAAFGLAIAPDYPAFYRIACNGATQELYLAIDFALTKERPSAEFHVTPLYWTLDDDALTARPVASLADSKNVDPNGSTPFRAGFDVYRQAYPDAFAVRALKQGNWMAFAKISKVPHPEDFGFRFKEGVDEPSFDDTLGVSTFRYTEPMTWWQQVPKKDGEPRSIDSALKSAQEIALKNERNENGSPKGYVAESQALLTTGMRDENGKLYGMLLDTPWCDGVVWSMNDAPGLVELAKQGALKNDENAPLADAGIAPVAGFELKWNEKLTNEWYGKPLPQERLPQTRDEWIAAASQNGVDGEYVDSSEGYVTIELDYARANFKGMTTPLVYDSTSKQPAIFRNLVAYEYVRKIAEDVHARGKLAMANSTPYSCFWLTPQLDVLGTETNWNYGGWRPMIDDDLMFRRVLCCGKPYCFLMNTNFDNFSNEMTELYMKRALAYGMFPSYFSADASTKHYFENAELYERDRPSFKRYMPLVIEVAESGWEPETGAKSNDDLIYVERFGALSDSSVASNPMRPTDAVYLTVYNDAKEEKAFEIALNPALTRHANSCRELLEDADVKIVDGKIVGKLPAQDVRVYKFTR